MKKILYIILAAVLCCTSSCTDYLDRKNLDTMEEESYWTSESKVRIYAQRFYAISNSENAAYFIGYGSGYSYGTMFAWAPWADDITSAAQWATNTAASGNGWDFTLVRNANILINRVDQVPMSNEAKNHWRGIGRFFRALRYCTLAANFGDVPWIDREILPGVDDDIMYKPRDPLATVCRNIIADFEYAAQYVRKNDGLQQVNRDVVLSYYSYYMLFFGTFVKYHYNDIALSNELLEKAVWASNEIMQTGNYQIVDNYRGLFTSESLAGNKEVILYREYAAGKVMHVMVSYNNREGQTGISKETFESYLASDGLPIKQSPTFNYAIDNGMRKYEDAYKNRDPRLAATFVDTVRINKQHTGYSTTGIASWKFLPDGLTPLEASTDPRYVSSTNTTDAPVIRYAQILLNYAEAKAELGTLTQADLDISINLLRNRNIKLHPTSSTSPILPKLPPLKLQGGMPAVEVGGVLTTIDDPDRDPTVPSLIWEIRRERRSELMFEGYRRDDLRRWKKFEYLVSDVKKNGNVPFDITLGVWIDETDYPKFNWTAIKKDVLFYYPNPADKKKGFIYTQTKSTEQRNWVNGDIQFERQYLNSVPRDQIKQYKDRGVTLTQNPGWLSE